MYADRAVFQTALRGQQVKQANDCCLSALNLRIVAVSTLEILLKVPPSNANVLKCWVCSTKVFHVVVQLSLTSPFLSAN
jgi:curli biogenesis system outer membrane secretion channel CsgG